MCRRQEFLSFFVVVYFVAFSGDLVRLVKRYLFYKIERYCYGNNFSLYRSIYRFRYV